MIYVIVTNRPYNETHGNVSVPTGTKRFIEDIQQGNGSNPSPNPNTPNPNPNPSSPQPEIPPPNDIWLKSIFLPQVDNLSLLTISNFTWTNMTSVYKDWTDFRVYLQFGNGTNAVKSSRKRFWSGGLVIGSWSAMVRLDAGTVVSIDWDDGCEECDADHCLDNVCALDQTSCYGRNCDLKIYLGWIGDDTNKIYCTSAGSLPSNFRTFSFGTIFPYAARAAYNPALTIFSK